MGLSLMLGWVALSGAAPPSLAAGRLGARLSLGLNLTTLNTYSVPYTVDTPDPFSGFGGRITAGGLWAPSPAFAIFAGAGYQNLVSPPVLDHQLVEGVPLNQAHFGFVQAGVEFRRGPFWFSFGPEAGLFSANAVVEYATRGPMALSQDGFHYTQLVVPATVGLRALGFGGSLDLGIHLFELGPMQGAVVLGGGGLYVPGCLVSWWQLGVRLVPDFMR